MWVMCRTCVWIRTINEGNVEEIHTVLGVVLMIGGVEKVVDRGGEGEWVGGVDLCTKIQRQEHWDNSLMLHRKVEQKVAEAILKVE